VELFRNLRYNGSNKTLPNSWGYNWATLFSGKINTGIWPSTLGVHKKLRQKNMVTRPEELEPEKDCAVDAQQQL
jgi:hypothetical protein